MRNEYSSTFIFHIPQEMFDGLIENINGFKVNIDTENLFEDKTIICIDFENILQYWEFINHLKNSPYYKYWEGYQNQQEVTDFIDSINERRIEWDLQNVERIFHNEPGWWSKRGDPYSWYYFAALLNKGYINVKVIPCPLTEKPSRDSEMYTAYRAAMTSRGNNIQIGGANWYAWNWLKELGDPLPGFPSSLSNVSSENLGIEVKVGEGAPSQILNYILGPDRKYVHIPFGDVLNLYIFSADSRIVNWKKGFQPEREEILQEAIKIEQIERIRIQSKEEELHKKFLESCQLKNIKTGSRLFSERIQNICTHDETSPLKKELVSSDKIRKWIKDGVILGEKEGNKWFIYKEELEKFFATMTTNS